MKKSFFSAFFLGLVFLNFAFPGKNEAVSSKIFIEPVEGLSEDFMMGVDISMLQDIEDNGGVYFDSQGNKEDLFKILKDCGVNWIRLRVWNNPTVDGKPYGGGNNSVETDLKLAVRAKKSGFKLLVDFHYSDSWADPGKQNMSQDWVGLNEKKLNAEVEKFTKESIEKFINAGARPDAVQIGNELNNGFMWPLGKIWGDEGEKVGGFKGFISLLKSASRGVRSAQGSGEKIKIVIHLADGGRNELYRSVFDPVVKAGVDFDIIGLSFYTYWHGSIQDLKDNMTDLSKRYGKELAVVETAYGYTEEDADDQGNSFMVYSDEKHGYLPTVQGQATSIRDIIEAVASVKGGTGVFYWEPAWIPVKGAGLSFAEGNSWDNQAMFDSKGRVLPSLSVWSLVRGGKEVSNVWGGSASNSKNFHPYKMADSLEVVCKPGEVPLLPEKVKLVFTNDSESLVDVKWEEKDWGKTENGKYILKGKTISFDFVPEITVVVSDRTNLIADPSFESGKFGEWKYNGPDGACYMENNKSNAHTGKWTYKYWLANGFQSLITKEFKAIPDGKYELSVWAMGGGNDKNIRLFASGFDGTDKQVTCKIVNTGWQVWKQYKIPVDVKGGNVTVGIYLETSPDCWGNFDDIEFIKID